MRKGWCGQRTPTCQTWFRAVGGCPKAVGEQVYVSHRYGFPQTLNNPGSSRCQPGQELPPLSCPERMGLTQSLRVATARQPPARPSPSLHPAGLRLCTWLPTCFQDHLGLQDGSVSAGDSTHGIRALGELTNNRPLPKWSGTATRWAPTHPKILAERETACGGLGHAGAVAGGWSCCAKQEGSSWKDGKRNYPVMQESHFWGYSPSPRIDSRPSKRYLHTHVHSSIIRSSPSVH